MIFELNGILFENDTVTVRIENVIQEPEKDRTTLIITLKTKVPISNECLDDIEEIKEFMDKTIYVALLKGIKQYKNSKK